MSDLPRQVILVVLDGFGYREATDGNAVAMARMPMWTALWSRAPRTLLHASGRAVGLPEGQMGNSEVGHLNLGAGRVVKQDLVRIDESIEDGSFFTKQAFLDACRQVRANGGTLHLMGLLGDGGVHAMNRHLFALIDLCAREEVPRIALHCLIDGRDTMPTSGLRYMRDVLRHAGDRVVIASLGGRYFGMDRDRRWERVQRWYDVAVLGRGPQARDPLGAIEAAYARGETDEFITPVVISNPDGSPRAPMRSGDAVIAFNFRSLRFSVLQAPPHRWLVWAVLSQIVILAGLMQIPSIRESFGIAIPSLSMLALILGISAFVFLAMELTKVIFRRKFSGGDGGGTPA